MKLNTQRTRRFILLAMVLVALLGNLIVPTSQAAMMTPAAAVAMKKVSAWRINAVARADTRASSV